MGYTDCRQALEMDMLNSKKLWEYKLLIFLFFFTIIFSIHIYVDEYIQQHLIVYLLTIIPPLLFLYYFVYQYVLYKLLLNEDDISDAKIIECQRWQEANNETCPDKVDNVCVIPDDFPVFN